MLRVRKSNWRKDSISEWRRRPDANGAGDEALIRRVAEADDEGALSELYDRYGGLVYGLGIRLLRDRQLSEDLVQDVFTSVWRKAASFDPARASFSTWIYQIARNRATDLDRRSRARPRVVEDESRIQLAENDASRQVPESLDVLEALSHLSPEHREILILAYFRGLTQREIASSTETPLGTVKSRTSAALKALRRAMTRENGDG